MTITIKKLDGTRMKTWLLRNKIMIGLTALVILTTSIYIRQVRIPGHMDVITAQAMDMSQMRPPTGSAEVTFATARMGTISDTVTYTGTIKPFNEEDLASRVAGVVQSIPVYPGDHVQAGEVVAQLDTTEAGARTQQALADADSAQDAAQVAHLTHHLHHSAALDSASSKVQASAAALQSAQSDANVSEAGITDAQAAVRGAKANSDYWIAEIAREKALEVAGAVSQQDYQNELAQYQDAASALDQANAKQIEAVSAASSAQAKVSESESQLRSAIADKRMAVADIAIASGQAAEAESNAASADAAARQARIVEGYSQIRSLTAGFVFDRPIAPGSLVEQGTTVVKVEDIDRVRLQANVAITDLADIHRGTKVVISVPGADGTPPFLASVTAVFPSANDESRTAIVEAVVPNLNHDLLPGGFVSMKIARQTESDDLLVPSDSVISQDGQNYLWVAQADSSPGTIYECVICHIHYSAKQAAQFNYKDPMDGGDLLPVAATSPQASSNSSQLKAHLVQITVGASNGKWTEIGPGNILPGERIVNQGQAGLTEGVRLTSD